jgi:hypothetical protein
MKQLTAELSKRHRGNDFSLSRAPVEEKANRADRNLALIIRRRHHHAEGSIR